MLNWINMREEIENLLIEKDRLKTKLKTWVIDKSVPLDERWEVFFKSGLGNHKSYYQDFKYFSTNNYCDDRGKYAVIDLENVEERYLEDLTEEQLIEFKEDVLSKFIKSFTFDW